MKAVLSTNPILNTHTDCAAGREVEGMGHKLSSHGKIPHPPVQEKYYRCGSGFWLVPRRKKEVCCQILVWRMEVNEGMSLLKQFLFARLTDGRGFDELVDHVKREERADLFFIPDGGCP